VYRRRQGGARPLQHGPPGPFGGNMDVREMIEGRRLFAGFVEVALLWSGDSHRRSATVRST